MLVAALTAPRSPAEAKKRGGADEVTGPTEAAGAIDLIAVLDEDREVSAARLVGRALKDHPQSWLAIAALPALGLVGVPVALDALGLPLPAWVTSLIAWGFLGMWPGVVMREFVQQLEGRGHSSLVRRVSQDLAPLGAAWAAATLGAFVWTWLGALALSATAEPARIFGIGMFVVGLFWIPAWIRSLTHYATHEGTHIPQLLGAGATIMQKETGISTENGSGDRLLLLACGLALPVGVPAAGFAAAYLTQGLLQTLGLWTLLGPLAEALLYAAGIWAAGLVLAPVILAGTVGELIFTVRRDRKLLADAESP